MKRTFTTLIILLHAIVIFALDPIETKSIVCADTWYGVEYDAMDDVYYGVTYYLGEDTIVNKVNYRSLWRTEGYLKNTICVGGLRQADEGMKVYYYNFYTSCGVPKQEYLLYDFTANVGDTIRDAYFRLEDMRLYTDFMGEPESVGWVVLNKYVQDDRIHMIIERCYEETDVEERYQTHWIQGIGSPNVLWPVNYGVAGRTTLYALCATQGDAKLFSYDVEYLHIENNCTEWHLKTDNIEDIISQKLSLFTLGNHLQVHVSSKLVCANIYNLNGQCVLQTNEKDIDISALPQGMYILRAETSDGVSHQAKFIKE